MAIPYATNPYPPLSASRLIKICVCVENHFGPHTIDNQKVMESNTLGCRKWVCKKWGLKGCLAALPGNRPKSAFLPFFCLFAFFRRAQTAPGKSRKRRKKAFFFRYPLTCLNPHLLNPHLRHSKHSSTFWISRFFYSVSVDGQGFCNSREPLPHRCARFLSLFCQSKLVFILGSCVLNYRERINGNLKRVI